MFERFTPAARAAVLLAQEEARTLRHGYIGTEHLLLALISDAEQPVAKVLAEAGIKSGDVRAEVLAIVGSGEGTPTGHIPFTPRAKKVLELSLREALALKHRNLSAEHILLGIVREGEGLAALILTKHGVELEQLRRQVIERLGGEPSRRGRFLRGRPSRAFTSTPGGASVADRAVELAGEGPVASHHYLLGLLEDEETVAAKALAALGVTREEVEAKLAEIGTAGTSDDPPERQAAGRTRLSVEGERVRVELVDPDLARRLRPFVAGPVADLPGISAVWAATMPAVVNVVNQLEATPSLNPPGWTEAGVAALAVTSLPHGPITRLWYRPGTDPDPITAWLAAWLRQRSGIDECNYLTVAVDQVDDRIVLIGASTGIAPAGARWLPRPLPELVAAAVASLDPGAGDTPAG